MNGDRPSTKVIMSSEGYGMSGSDLEVELTICWKTF
jgi:hypothetical protein